MENQQDHISDESAIPALLQRFQECDLALNKQVSNKLVRLDSEAVVSGLLNILQTPDLPPFVHKQAVKVLGRLNSDVVPALLQALKHPNLDVRELAAQNLERFRTDHISDESAIPALLQRFQECDLALNKQVSNKLVRLDSEAVVSGLLNILQTPDLPPFVHKQAVKVLGRLNSDVVPALLQALKHPNLDVRKLAAQNLGQFRSKPNWNQDEILPALLQVLEHSNFDLCKLAAQSLGWFGSRLTIPDLLLVLRKNSEICNEFRSTFKKSLTQQGRIAVPNLLAALKHSSGDVRSLAAEGLWYLGTEAETSDLLEAVQDSDSRVRSHAEAALKKIRDPQSFLMPVARAHSGYITEGDETGFITAMREQGFVNDSEEELLKAFQQVKNYIDTPCSNSSLASAAISYAFSGRALSYDEGKFITAMRERGFVDESEEELLKAYLQAHRAVQKIF